MVSTFNLSAFNLSAVIRIAQISAVQRVTARLGECRYLDLFADPALRSPCVRPQAKFSELTIDMFRMLQTLEREPQEDGLHNSCETSPNSARTPYVSNAAGRLSSCAGVRRG